MGKEKRPNDWRLWALLAITIIAMFWNAVQNYAIKGNELKHLVQNLKQFQETVEKRLDRIEDFLWFQ